ncbi:MAG TPA: class 1 isoprenoid biosynthesis enzyme [Streptosporangiaceae bacterium]|nr:class 1 isoprenoid biosynthesis enzyme [Streptosporangiaceae bacterium]
MPQALAEEAAHNPFGVVGDRARRQLAEAVPALAGDLESFPLSVFGLTSGFFYVTAAQGRAWGMRDSLVSGVLTIQALGHLHFAFHDAVIDDGYAPAIMCLLSDAALLSYLQGLATLSGQPASVYQELHREYYDLYVAAIKRDLAHRDSLFGYTVDDILGLGNKAAPGAVMVQLIADLTGHPNRGQPTAQAMLRLCTGLQLVDDLNDSADDAAAGNRTWPVTSALLAYPDLDVTDRGTVEAAVAGSGVAAGCLKLAADAFADARGIAGHADATVLADLADMWHRRTLRRERLLREALHAT